MTSTAQAATLFAAEDLRVVARDLGALAPGMVRIAFGAGGVCGSDMHYFRHARTGDFVVKSPLVLGHEIAGTIVALNGDAPGLTVGDRVAVNPSRWCGHCGHCQADRMNLCDNIYFMGSASKTPHMQGGFATMFDAIPAQCVKIPSHVTFEAAALAEPLAVCLHAVARAGSIRGQRGLIVGAGPIGLLTMRAAQRAGLASVAVADIAAAPLAYAQRLGASAIVDVAADPEALPAIASSDPFDVVFEASGTPAGLATAVLAARRGGKIVQIGNLPGGSIPFPANAVMAKELTLLGTFRFGSEFGEAVRLISAGEIDTTEIISARRPLADAPAALRLALDRSQSMKVMLVAST
jgi:L-idonate 5-dehydrogenase